MDVERERIMEIIQKTLQGLHPSMKVVRRVSYREGGHPLVYTVSGRVEPVEVCDNVLSLDFHNPDGSHDTYSDP